MVVFNVVTQVLSNIIDYIVVSVIVMSEIQVDGHFVLCISTRKGGCPSKLWDRLPGLEFNLLVISGCLFCYVIEG